MPFFSKLAEPLAFFATAIAGAPEPESLAPSPVPSPASSHASSANPSSERSTTPQHAISPLFDTLVVPQLARAAPVVPPLPHKSMATPPRRRRAASTERLDRRPRTAQASRVRRHSMTTEATGHTLSLAPSPIPPANLQKPMSMEETELLTRATQATDLDCLLDTYAELSPTSQSSQGLHALLATVVHKGATASARPVYEFYSRMVLHGPVIDDRVYNMVIELLCHRDIELGGRVAPGEPDYFALALDVARRAGASKELLHSASPYNELLHCCALRGDVHAAVSVVSLFESNLATFKDADSYNWLLQIFSNAASAAGPAASESIRASALEACEYIFTTFLRVANAWRHIEPARSAFALPKCASVWATMFDTHFALGDPFGAVVLFERMLATAAENAAAPPLDADLVSHMITGFVHVGEYRAAVQWLHHLHAPHLPAPSVAAYNELLSAAAQAPPHSSVLLLRDLAHALANDEALSLHTQDAAPRCVRDLADVLAERRFVPHLSEYDVSTCFYALYRLGARLFRGFNARQPLRSRMQVAPVAAVLHLAAQQADTGHAAVVATLFALAVLAVQHADLSSAPAVSLVCDACHLPMAIADAALAAPHALDDSAARFVALATLVQPSLDGVRGSLRDAAAGALIREFEAASRDVRGDLRRLSLDAATWASLVHVFLASELASPGTFPGQDGYTGLGKLLAQLAQLPERPALDLAEIEAVLVRKYGEAGRALVQGWKVRRDLEEHAEAPCSAKASLSLARAAAEPSAECALHVDGVLSPRLPPVRQLGHSLCSMLMGLARAQGQQHADEAFERVQTQQRRGVYATPAALAVLINAFGRTGRVDRIDELYEQAMHVLASAEQPPEWRQQQWAQLEDGMVTALSHAMQGERANAHRLRLLAAQQVPSASAYAALIATIQERTDDAVVAEELFQESQRLGVRPTTYLYNTVISKLSRARKVEQALRLFDEMRTSNLRPSSVTYGAAINACVRTGVEARATQLFQEMEAQPTFQPRVPPYNTMIQYYVHSAQNRDKALEYYEKMQQAGVRPSAHTYKLLLDAWGTIEPVQPERQQAVFVRLSADRLVGVQGTHWASLIHTHGVVLKDLDRALEIFESIADRGPAAPRGPAKASSTVPDAVVYEALFAVFVAQGRTDLMPTYLSRMVAQGILPTAYIANLLIKGYAQDGPLGLAEARRLFDAMGDPPAGVAAAGNHLPRHQGAGALGARRERPASRHPEPAVDRANVLGTLVNREPSTYEAMIKAELAYGHTDRATAILERMRARAFPAALLHRAQALFDHV